MTIFGNIVSFPGYISPDHDAKLLSTVGRGGGGSVIMMTSHFWQVSHHTKPRKLKNRGWIRNDNITYNFGQFLLKVSGLVTGNLQLKNATPKWLPVSLCAITSSVPPKTRYKYIKEMSHSCCMPSQGIPERYLRVDFKPLTVLGTQHPTWGGTLVKSVGFFRHWC